MRKLPTLSLLSVAVPALLTLPVVTPPVEAPQPVETAVHTLSLAGVDDAALAAQGSSSTSASLKARAAMPAAERGAAPVKEPAVLTRELSTKEFQTLGVTWTSAGPIDLTVLVRTKGEDDGWSSWLPLEQSDTPDDETAVAGTRQGTDPYFVGPSDGVQVRVDVRSGRLPADLRVDLVDPGESDADATIGRAAASTAAAAVSRPRIYSRADWGADESLRSGSPRYMPTIRAAVVHHTAGSNNYTRDQVPAVLRSDYAYHTKSRGWSDLGYNLVVDKFGRVWEGRAGGVDKPVQGAHTSGFNYETVGISVLGNYDTAATPTAAIDAVARTIAWKLSLHGRDPGGNVRLTSAGGGTSKYSRGKQVMLPVIFAHRNTSYTACPGKNIYSQMDTIRAKARAITSGSTLQPAPKPEPAVPALIKPTLDSPSTMTYSSKPSPVTVRADVARDQKWTLDVRQPCRTAPIRSYSGTASPASPISVRWDGRAADGTAARPGRYTLTLRSETAAPWSTRVDVGTPPTPRPPAPVALVDDANYVPVSPVRILDTRSGAVLPPGGGGRTDLTVLGVGGVPTSGVAAVALNVTSVCSAGDGHLTVWPAGQPQPASSSLNVPARDVRAALVTSGVGGEGKVSIYTRSLGDVVVDVVGYWSTSRTADGFSAVAPQRLYDSRDERQGSFGPGETRTITVPKLAGIASANMSSATLNVTVTSPENPGYLTVFPADGTPPETSSLNFATNETAANRVITSLRSGRFSIRNVSRDAHVVVDIVGFTAGRAANPRGTAFSPVAPVRVLDSRTAGGAVTPDDPRTVRVTGRSVPTDAKAVVMTLTAVRPTARGSAHLTVWAAGRARPGTSDLNVASGDVRANLVIAPVGAGGKVMVAPNTASSHVVLDVLGYYR